MTHQLYCIKDDTDCVKNVQKCVYLRIDDNKLDDVDEKVKHIVILLRRFCGMLKGCTEVLE